MLISDRLIPSVKTNLPSLESPGIEIYEVPVVIADEETLAEFASVVRDFESEEPKLLPWPKAGWRDVDCKFGRSSWVQGELSINFQGELMLAQEALSAPKVLGWFNDPSVASVMAKDVDTRALVVSEVSYQPNGGLVIYPRDGADFSVLLAPPGDDVLPEDFTVFYCDGSFGLHIQPGIWHQLVFPLSDRSVFQIKRSALDAQVQADMVKEGGVYLGVSLEVPLS